MLKNYFSKILNHEPAKNQAHSNYWVDRHLEQIELDLQNLNKLQESPGRNVQIDYMLTKIEEMNEILDSYFIRASKI